MTFRGKIVVALALLAGCAHKSPKVDAWSLRMQLARSLVQHREWAAATPALLALKQTRPKSPEVLVLLATVYREQGLYDEAASEYQAAVKVEPRYADAWGGLGVLRDLRGDAGDEALSDLKKAIALRPEIAAHYNNLGFALTLRGRYEDAVKAFREGLSRNPTSHRIRNNLGFAYGFLGHYNRAKREFDRGGTAAEAENNLGWVLEKAGDLESACGSYKTAAKMTDPPLQVALTNYQRACPEAEPQGGKQ